MKIQNINTDNEDYKLLQYIKKNYRCHCKDTKELLLSNGFELVDLGTSKKMWICSFDIHQREFKGKTYLMFGYYNILKHCRKNGFAFPVYRAFIKEVK